MDKQTPKQTVASAIAAAVGIDPEPNMYGGPIDDIYQQEDDGIDNDITFIEDSI